MLVLGSSENQVEYQDKPLALQSLAQADLWLFVLWLLLPSVPDGTPVSPWRCWRLQGLQVLPSDGSIQSSSGGECQLPQDLLVNSFFPLLKVDSSVRLWTD